MKIGARLNKRDHGPLGGGGGETDKGLMAIPWEMRAVLTTFRISAVEKGRNSCF